jgi:ATP-binding cassette, subfamily B, multidrug efflux pump
MKSLSYLNKYFVKYKWRLMLGVIFIVITNIFNVLKPEYFGDSVDRLKNWRAESDSDLLLEALTVGSVYLVFALLSGIFLFFTRQMIIIVSRHIEYDLKNEIYSHYQNLDYTFYKKNSTGDLMNRISEDVSQVRMYLGPGIMYTVNLAILCILAITNMILISPYLTLFVLLPLPLMSYLIYKVSSRINKISTEVQKEQSNMTTLVQETFSGIRVVKAYSRTGEIYDKFAGTSDAYKAKNMKLVRVNSFFMPTVYILIGISTILCIYIGGLFYYDESITLGEIIKFIFYVNMLTWPFASVGWVISIIQRAAASQTRINEFLETKPSIINPSSEPFTFNGKIEFKNVSYNYPNSGIEALKNVSFVLEKGQTLGIIGRTGSGKSTILKLLTRQMDPSSGSIEIDGVDLREINLSDFKDQIGSVPQEVFLFSDTIKNNLIFGTINSSATQLELEDVCRKAHVLQNIQDFPDSFETYLGERGVNLSGGQKQRVSIARALIRKPKLLLLDDCLSAVDTETEEIILRNLTEQKIDGTIVVSHRISSIRNADFILTLDMGEVVEKGSHSQLIDQNGLYAQFYQKQLLEEKQSPEFED